MTHAIVVDGLVRRFRDVVALDGIGFEVPAGTVFGLLGPNGAGKTTTVRILATILPPDSGRAEVLGFDVVRDRHAVRRVIGLAGQYAAVDANLTGAENLRLVGKLAHLQGRTARQRAGELLERFGLAAAGNRPVRTYSGGMRRRLDLAAALVHRPPVLFLDEPTTGLDLQGRSDLWDMIRELLTEGATVVLTTQYLEEADRLAHRVAVVDDGRVIANDTPRALKARLGSTVTELGFASDSAALAAYAEIRKHLGSNAEREAKLVRFTSSDGARMLLEVLRKLDASGLQPSSVAVREPSLDDVFLALTGRHARHESQPQKTGADAA